MKLPNKTYFHQILLSDSARLARVLLRCSRAIAHALARFLLLPVRLAREASAPASVLRGDVVFMLVFVLRCGLSAQWRAETRLDGVLK